MSMIIFLVTLVWPIIGLFLVIGGAENFMTTSELVWWPVALIKYMIKSLYEVLTKW